jgi:hypothetical protein
MTFVENAPMENNSPFIITPKSRRILNLILLLLVLLGCQQSRTTDTHSSAMVSVSEKVAFLSRYAKMPSTPLDVEFHIVYQDNSGGMVAGPSEWDIKFAAIVKDEEMSKWTAGFQQFPDAESDFSWSKDILPQDTKWSLEGDPQYYRRSEDGVEMAVYPKKSLILKRIEKR